MNAIEALLLPYSKQSTNEELVHVGAKSEDSISPSYTARDLGCLENSLAPKSNGNEVVLAPRETKALPGYEENKSCSICKIRCRDEFSSLQANETGCTLAEFLCEAQKEFLKFNGRPIGDLSDEIAENLKLFARNLPEEIAALLSEVSSEEVMHHFKYDHLRQNPVKVKEKTMRMLVNMLEVGLSSCCEQLENGTLALTRDNSLLVLQIVDRIQKIASLKDDTVI